jgi:hypothetical protein
MHFWSVIELCSHVVGNPNSMDNFECWIRLGIGNHANYHFKSQDWSRDIEVISLKRDRSFYLSIYLSHKSKSMNSFLFSSMNHTHRLGLCSLLDLQWYLYLEHIVQRHHDTYHFWCLFLTLPSTLECKCPIETQVTTGMQSRYLTPKCPCLKSKHCIWVVFDNLKEHNF